MDDAAGRFRSTLSADPTAGKEQSGLPPSSAGGRYYTLDGIRGLAAIYVLIGHATNLFAPLPLPRFWLAVDLFFLMSGFVLGRVYEPRFASGMTIRQFMLQRYLRLYPLYLVGLSIGIVSSGVALLLNKGTLAPPAFVVATITGLLILPSPTWQSQGDIIPLNFPGWSLFFELLINLLFAMNWRRLTNRVLLFIIGCSALVLVVGFRVGAQFGGEGWGNVFWGLPRISFSFFLGLLINRRPTRTVRHSNQAWLVLLVPGVLLWLSPPHGELLDAGLVFFGFPLLLLWSTTVQPHKLGLFTTLGGVSYPVYVLHVPILSVLWRLLLFTGHTPADAAPWLGGIYLAGVVVLAMAADRYYDRAMRAWLLDRLARFPSRARRLVAADTPL